MANNDDLYKYIINTYSDMVYRIAIARCKNQEIAKDVYQSVFLKYAEKLPKFKSKEHEKAWFIKVTINMSKNELNKNWNKKVELYDESIENVSVQDVYSETIILDEVLKLPQNYKTVIYLMYYEGYKTKEISQLLSTSENTIKTWLSRAREILKEKIKEEI